MRASALMLCEYARCCIYTAATGHMAGLPQPQLRARCAWAWAVYLICVYALIFESTFEYTNVNVHMILFVETASLASAILQTPPCSSTTMTDVHDTSELLNPVDVGTERSALRSEDNLNPLGISFEQPHDDGIDAQHREAAGTNLPHREVAQIAIGASHQKIPRYSKSSVEDALTTSRVERWSSCITPTLNGRSSRHDALQDARSDPYFPPNFLSQDCNSDARPLKSAQGAKDDFLPGRECRATRECSTPRLSWLNGNIIFICSLSTALSASFAFLAMKGQRYGDYVGNHPKARMSRSTAIIWTSVVAKTIELSFVTGVVALLGQVLSRRALINSSQGVTLYELTMWRWIVQPGTLVTTTTARYAGISVLGVLTLLCTILSTVYGTAATALVQPVPRQSDWHSKTMVGSVMTDFANYEYIESLCPSPIPDKEYANVTCLQLDWAGTNYYNFGKFLSSWGDMVKSNKGTSMKQEQRPTWIGLPYANTTVVPQWIDVVDTTEMSKKNQRVINSVSLALPHIGVSNAVSDMRNDMPRSDTSDVIKAYSLWASVPSPVTRVLCVHMNETELAPIVYGAWNNDKLNATEWTETPGKQDATTTNMTVVDELFGWTKKDNESMLDYPPVFAKYPKPFNTIFNHTFNSWERPAIYLLGQGGSYYGGKNLTGQYPLCKLEMDISARCSTVHSVSVSGSKVKALCDDRAADMAYFKTQPNATTIRNVSGWKKFGLAWVNSLSLQTGMEDAEATSARNFMQLQLDSQASDVKLDPLSPSLAETLAITASYSLLMSFEDAPFVHYWVSVAMNRLVESPNPLV
jgi:hypothetical protein